MSALQMILLALILLASGTPLAGLWFWGLQARLERWDAEKHALD
jgi:hypothetical protein